MSHIHHYRARLVWDGNRGEGTAAYDRYERAYRVLIDQKPELAGSADVPFRGDAAKHNPEDLFLAAISACHMLAYLALCAKRGVRVLSYHDVAVATLRLDPGGAGCFEEIELQPAVTVATRLDLDGARELHDEAHRNCFIASSCRVPVRHRATIRLAPDVVA